MNMEHLANDKAQIGRALEATIHIGLVILLVAACLMILLPFLPLIAWGIIIAIASYPGYRKLQTVLGERGNLAAALWTVLLLAILIVPTFLLMQTLIEGVQGLISHLRDGTLAVPPPPARVETWPVVGPPLKALWSAASANLTDVLRKFTPQIKGVVPGLLSTSAGIGLGVLQFVLAIVLSGFLLAYARGGAQATHSLATRLFGEKGPEFEDLAGSTIRSVTTGILGVALIQSVCAGLGFLVVGLPAAGLWAVVFLLAAVLQIGAVVLVPAVIYVFAIASTTKAVIFLVWCIIVALMDNVLKPLLLGRGVAVPIVVVFLGAIGGFVAMGIIGLFLGAIVLSVGYKVSLAWLQQASQVERPGQQISRQPEAE
ncbi:MAG TPA: AI-2E family transporter [Terriglobales bacterium]|nr:AI-2E family transporter [Terriglobales bacterium]